MNRHIQLIQSKSSEVLSLY